MYIYGHSKMHVLIFIYIYIPTMYIFIVYYNDCSE